MWQKAFRAAFAASLLLASLASALPHGDDESMDMNMDMGTVAKPEPHTDGGDNSPMSYFAYGKHSGTIVAHIALMVLAWCFILPVAVMFSVARSRFALPSQFLFLVLNAFGLLIGIIYNSQTPDLYENNAHHKIGWIATWVISAQVVMSLIFAYAGRGEKATENEQAAFLPVATEDMADSPHTYPYGINHDYRWSRDSGQGTERNSSSIHSRPDSPSCSSPSEEFAGFDKPEDQIDEKPVTRGWLANTGLGRFLTSRVPGMVSSRALRIFSIVYLVIDRIILPFGFIAITTGAVTYGGIMRGHDIFNGLAHFIKGGIFFWYGLLTLGRWMGCWADLGWAWNVKPPSGVVSKWKAKIQTAEFTESAVIFSYGASNVFLEHLGGWGGAWTSSDLEHISITIMFFGAGLCGMLVESKRVRNWLNSTVLQHPAHIGGAHGSTDATWQVPDTQGVSLNPMPALVILLLGMMMGSHHQESMISTMVHKQWGNMLVGFGLARAATYVLMYIKPPTSYLPSRPPTEIVASFCLTAGGLIFMLSTANVISVMEYYEMDAMFTFTVGMGFTAFIMSLEILAIALKAWAVKKESRPQLPPFQFPAAT